jgi:5-oxopent-3-ene-1,2,5-tricarboxylate decarboxylase/2-hydroxyhepta-2,4-diene-1,7-dioate isomerase
MKRARFLAQGRRHDGVLAAPGVLVDEAGVRHAEDAVTFLPPVVPQTVIGLALNFAAHADEMSLQQPPEPALFFKGPNTWVGHRAPVVQPANVEYMHYEAELAVVIGRPARRVRAADAFDVVGGYTIANDVTVRDFVTNTYRPPIKGKGWDTFCPFGPYLVTDEVEDPHALGLRAYVNGELRQEGSTSDFVRGIPELIEYVTEFMTLQPGDLILTGTPKGISHVYPGDTMRIEVDGLGALENPVVADAPEGRA